MGAGDLQAIRAAGFVVAIAVAILLQRLSPHARAGGSARVNAALGVLGAVLVGAICGGCAFDAAVWAEQRGLGLLHGSAAPAWIAMPLTLVTLDLVSYGWHRANHRVGPLWRLHRVHHSDTRFTVSTGLRFHPGELLLALPVRLTAIVLLGAPVEAVLAFEVLFGLANLVEHGDIAIARAVEGPLARVFVTPALHRRHHARTRPDRDSNFGTVFVLWDRLLGTYAHADSATRVDPGLPGVDETTLLGALVLPIRAHELRHAG